MIVGVTEKNERIQNNKNTTHTRTHAKIAEN